jgi:hypothetical protein
MRYTKPRHTLSAATRRKISLAQKARWAKRASTNGQVVAVKPKRNNVSCISQEDRGVPASQVGESEAAEEGRVGVSHYAGKTQNANPHPSPHHCPEDGPRIDLNAGPGTALL